MYTKFNQTLESVFNLKKGSRILLAVSGGIDSMVLMHLLNRSDVVLYLAHCNFGLRGKESDGDEEFILSQAKSHDIPVFVKRFTTNAYAQDHGISVQMAARELRYNYFEEIRQQHKLDYIAIAHNKNDSIETLFINLCRGTGLKGLVSMKAYIPEKKIIRPLLQFTRNEIVHYAGEYGIPYREDSSNASDKYTRNAIRHHIIPKLEEIFPKAVEQISKSINYFTQSTLLIEDTINNLKKSIIAVEEENVLTINIKALDQIQLAEYVLFEILNEYGFTSEDISRVYESRIGQSGKKFESNDYLLIKDRNHFILKKKQKQNNLDSIEINQYSDFCKTNVIFDSQIIEWQQSKEIDKNPENAMLDYEKIHFPLVLRKWKDGDYFYPLGMNRRKKLSDFFIDNKIPITEKNNIWLLKEKNGAIIWVVNLRIDNRFKITKDTKKALKLTALNNKKAQVKPVL